MRTNPERGSVETKRFNFWADHKKESLPFAGQKKGENDNE